MAQKPRPLDPSLSSRALFGCQLRLLRDDAGMSQTQLGAELHVTGEAVATWEKGRSLPDERTIARADDLLNGRGLLLAAWRLAARDTHANSDANNGPDAPPRSPLPGMLAASSYQRPEIDLLDTAALEAAEFGAWAEQLHTGEVAIQAMQIRIRRLADDCLTAAPAEAFSEAYSLSRQLFGLLRGHNKPAHARELYRLAGQVSVLQAWLAGDLGAYEAAEVHGRTAQVCADHADEPEIQAWAAVARSKTAFWRTDYANAAAIAQRALGHQAPGTATVMLACQVADAYAQLGAGDATREALGRAADAAERERGSDTVGGLLSCKPGRHANYAAGAHLRLGDHDRALDEADIALEVMRTDPRYGFGTIAQTHVTRIIAQLDAGDIDAAADAARPVLDLPRGRRLTTLTDRMRPLSRALDTGPIRDSPVAVALRDEIMDFCGASGGQRQITAGNQNRELEQA